MTGSRKRTVALIAATVVAGVVGQGLVGAATADSCLSVDATGVCFPTQNTTVVPGETVGGPVNVPSQTVGGDITGGSIPVNSPTQVCYLLGCIAQGQTIATVPEISVPRQTTPSETVPVPQETTPPVVLPFDPTHPRVEGLSSADAAAIIGTGTISPGLTTVPAYQGSVTFSANLAAFAGDHGVAAPCSLSFFGQSDIAETVTTGQGHGTVSGCLSGTLTYQRTSEIMRISGNLNGEAILAMACIWTPTSINPVATYQLTCTATLAS